MYIMYIFFKYICILYYIRRMCTYPSGPYSDGLTYNRIIMPNEIVIYEHTCLYFQETERWCIILLLLLWALSSCGLRRRTSISYRSHPLVRCHPFRQLIRMGRINNVFIYIFFARICDVTCERRHWLCNAQHSILRHIVF